MGLQRLLLLTLLTFVRHRPVLQFQSPPLSLAWCSDSMYVKGVVGNTAKFCCKFTAKTDSERVFEIGKQLSKA